EAKANPRARARRSEFAKASRRISQTGPTQQMQISILLRRLMTLISGRARETSAWTSRPRRNTFRRMWSAMRISTNTDSGETRRSTDQSGFRAALEWGGRLTGTVTGFGSIRGAGPGLTTSLGAMLPSTTVAGSITTITGAGLRDRSGTGRTTLLLWSRGLVVQDGESALASAAAMDGARWAGVNRLCPGMVL